MSEVDVFGTLHVDRPSKVKAELIEFSDDVDTFFVESPREESDEGDNRRLLLRNPIFWVTGWILDFAWGIPGYLLTGQFRPVDGYAIDSVAQEQGIDIEPVDMNLLHRASDITIWVTILSWLLMILALTLFGLAIILPSLNVLIWAILVGFAPVAPFAIVTLPERDELMAENIEDILSSRKEGQNACLVVGRGHMKGVIAELEESNVEVRETHKSKFFRRSLSTN